MMISKSYKILWVCFVLIFTSNQFIIAQDFYVSDSNGSDNNSGTLEAPFKTINKGISMVSAGGTVYVMDGVYQNENYGNVEWQEGEARLIDLGSMHQVMNKSNEPRIHIIIHSEPIDDWSGVMQLVCDSYGKEYNGSK